MAVMTPGAAAAAGGGAASTTAARGAAAPGRAADKDKQTAVSMRKLVAWHLNKQYTDEEETVWPYFLAFYSRIHIVKCHIT